MKNTDKQITKKQKKKAKDSNRMELGKNGEVETNPGIWTEEEQKRVPSCEGKWI